MCKKMLSECFGWNYLINFVYENALLPKIMNNYSTTYSFTDECRNLWFSAKYVVNNLFFCGNRVNTHTHTHTHILIARIL